MNNDSRLQSAVRLALGVGAGALAVSASPGALAQDDGAGQIEEITVTGSRIKRADLDSASPVTVIDREAIMAQGITDVGNLIQRIPSMSGTPLGTTTNNGNTAEGTVQIDLRGMGTKRTLTLINGMRTVDGGDYTTIPAIMIERVEILKDGASAVYGADAVAGVVNIITRSDFEGINIDAQTNAWFDTDNGEQYSIGLVAGHNFDNGNFMFGAEFIEQKTAFQSDMPWDTFQGSYYIYYDADVGCEVDPANLCTFFGSSRIPESRLNFFSQGRYLVPTPGAAMVPHDGRTYNYAPVNYMQTPFDRLNVFGEGFFDVSENTRFRASFRGSRRNSAQELAPLPYDTNIDPGFAGNWQGTPYTGVSEQNFYLRQAVDDFNAANGANLIYEPLNNARRRMTETPRHFSQDLTQFQAMIGFDGTFGDSMDWDVYYNTGKRSIVNNDLGQFSGVRLTNALGPSADLNGDGVPECYGDIADPNTLVPGCTPLNLFGGEGTVTQDMLDYVGVNLVDTRVKEQEIFSGSVSGSVFELPGGEMGWAAGYQYIDNKFKYSPDSAKSIGAVTGGTGAGTDGFLRSNSVFGELFIPVFDNGAQALDLTAGARWDDYNLFGSDTTWQFGIEFRAIESLKLRATAGTAFRAPTIEELFDGLQDDAPNYNDPCDPGNYAVPGVPPPGCTRVAVQSDTQVKALVGGNALLVPETAQNFTAGVVWTPEFADSNLSITLDWWQIEVEEAISSFGVQFTLDQCYLSQVQSSCDLITRRNDADWTIRDIIDTNVNIATSNGEGIDTEVRYAWDSAIGEFDFALLWAHLLDRNKTPRPGAANEDLTGRHTNVTAEDGGTYAEDKANFSVRYFRNSFSIGYLAEYISAIEADAFGPDYSYTVDSFLYHDLVVNYEFSQYGNTLLTAGVTNITDEKPPFIDNAFNAKTDPNTYRMFGTGWFARISYTFE